MREHGGQPRNTAAFQSLFAGGDGPAGPSRARRRDKGRRGRGDHPAAGFKLREVAADSLEGQARAQGADPQVLASLCQAFGQLYTGDAIADVLASCGNDANRALDALLAMSGGATPGTEPCGAGVPAGSEAAGWGDSPALSPAPPTHQPHNLWSLLSEDLKLLILRQLNVLELAQAARVSREFAGHSRVLSASAHRLVVHEGVGTCPGAPGGSGGEREGKTGGCPGRTAVKRRRSSGWVHGHACQGWAGGRGHAGHHAHTQAHEWRGRTPRDPLPDSSLPPLHPPIPHLTTPQLPGPLVWQACRPLL